MKLLKIWKGRWYVTIKIIIWKIQIRKLGDITYWCRNWPHEIAGREVKECQARKLTKTRRNLGVIKIIESQVELSYVRKKEKATIGSDIAVKPTTAKVEANHVTSHRITCYSIPWAAISILFPRHHLWTRLLIYFITVRRRMLFKRKELLKLE